MSLTEDVKAFAREQGADLVGVAPIERFEGSPDFYHPRTLLPHTRSVVSIAIRHLNGVLVPQKNRVEHYPYQSLGYGWVSNIRLNWIAFELARFLEDRGHITCPFPSFFQGKKAGISNRHAAALAGLSRFGWSNLAMTPEYGPRQRFVTVLTAAELEPDPLLEDELCDGCMKCVKACPVGALSRDEAVEYELAGRPVRMAKLDRGKCGPCHAGQGGGFEGGNPAHVTFSDGGHCGMCLIHCSKGTRPLAAEL